jgi:aminoglycoside phosphotransferase (APT) family kinase protein
MITENDIVPFDTATFVDATYAWAHILIDLRYLTSQDFDHLRRFPIPDIHGHSLCHGDYHAAQCIVSQGMITAVIDWEAAFAADRRVDYAVTSTYLKLYGNQSLVGHFERGYATHWQYDPSVSDQFRSIRLISWLNMMKAWHSRGEVFWNELMQNGRITRVVALLREEARLV